MVGIEKTMHEFKEGKLHSGSKKGPQVKSRAQAIAIGLSEERKAGHKVAPKPKHHSFESSNQPFGQTTGGERAAHAVEQGHKVSGRGKMVDGAGKSGHDVTGHRAHSEHKAPTHPMSGVHSEAGEHGPSSFGHPGMELRLGQNGGIIGKSFGPGESAEGAEAPAGRGPGANGFPGHHAEMGTKAHGFGHAAHQRHGAHRVSGHPGAHRIGKR